MTDTTQALWNQLTGGAVLPPNPADEQEPVTRVDHGAEALRHIRWAHEQQESEGDLGTVVRDDALIAQAHATLALVEQQRIANQIAYLHIAEGVRGGRAPFDAGIARLDVEIREGLGLL